jgi:hypothetical protein
VTVRLGEGKRCGHGRPAPCVYCLCRVSPRDFYELMKWRAELRRTGKLRRGT